MSTSMSYTAPFLLGREKTGRAERCNVSKDSKTVAPPSVMFRGRELTGSVTMEQLAQISAKTGGGRMTSDETLTIMDSGVEVKFTPTEKDFLRTHKATYLTLGL